MQDSPTNIIWVISLGTAVLLIFAIAYIAIVFSSSRRVIETQRARVEEVTKSAERYRALFEQSLAGMMKFSIESWKVHEGNESLITMFGCSSGEDLSTCFAKMPDAAREFVRTGLDTAGIVSEYEIKTKRRDGTDIWILFSAKKVDGDGFAHAVVIDITKRKLFEAMVRDQAALLNETQDAIILIGESGRISFWNHGAEKMYGWGASEVMGISFQRLLYPDQKAEEYHHILDRVLSDQEWEGEDRHSRKDGQEILVVSRWRTVQQKNDERRTLLIVNTDITARRKLETRFIKTQRMESIALLTGGIAHDLQNILAPVAMSIGLLRDELKDQTSLTVLRAVEESAESGLQLVKNILTYGKGIVGDRVSVDLSDVLHQVLSIIENGLSPTIVVNKEISEEGWCVRGDKSQLKQVFLNICVNARDAMPNGGVLGVKVEESVIDETECENLPDSIPGRYVVVNVSDSGKGIPEENLDRIFEPFFTTKDGGERSGLGLSIVMGIVKSHNGFITVNSILHHGTTFRVYLPFPEDATT